MDAEFKGRIIYSENYQSTINSIKLINSSSGNNTSIIKQNREFIDSSLPSEISLIKGYENITFINENNLKPPKVLSAYDESILESNTLEGKIRCTAHCTVIQTEKEFIPAGFVTLKFFTRSKNIYAKSTELSDIIQSVDIAKSTTEEYVKERKFFLSKAAPNNSLMFIDGPMFSGAATNGNFILIHDLMDKSCRPVFFVKNSESTIITERFEFANGFNSDLHWAYSTLSKAEVSPVFSYTIEGRSKAMCFMKIFDNKSPVRIEFPLKEFEEGWYGDEVFDIIYYQYLASGNTSNVQPRIIQVSEMYAREILKSTNMYKEIEKMGLVKNMNDERNMF